MSKFGSIGFSQISGFQNFPSSTVLKKNAKLKVGLW